MTLHHFLLEQNNDPSGIQIQKENSKEKHVQWKGLEPGPSSWSDREAYHITKEPPFEVEDLFHQ